MNNISNIRSKLDLYYETIENLRYQDIEQMKESAEELLNYSYLINEEFGQAFANCYLATYYILKHKFESAHFYLNKAKRLCIQRDFQKLLAKCYHNEALIYQISGDSFKAIQIYGKALAIVESTQDLESAGLLYNNIAVILMGYKDYPLSKEYFEKASRNLAGEKQEAYYLFQVYCNLAQICCAMKEPIVAQMYLYKAQAIPRENNLELTLYATQIRYFAQIDSKQELMNVYQQVIEYVNTRDDLQFCIDDLLLIAQSLLLVRKQQECRYIMNLIEENFDKQDAQVEKPFLKLYIDYSEVFHENPRDAYKNYYAFLMKSEQVEYEGLAQSLQSRMELFERNQKHSKLIEEHENLQKQAQLDEVTGLYNRRYFDKLITKLESDATVERIGCAMIDVDYFKQYNDIYGHLEGDVVLQTIATLLQKYTETGVFACRYGGDEFVCLFANGSDEKIHRYLQHVYDALEKLDITHSYSSHKRVTLSAGYHCTLKANMDMVSLIAKADEALYKSKEVGRNHFSKL